MVPVARYCNRTYPGCSGGAVGHTATDYDCARAGVVLVGYGLLVQVLLVFQWGLIQKELVLSVKKNGSHLKGGYFLILAITGYWLLSLLIIFAGHFDDYCDGDTI